MIALLRRWWRQLRGWIWNKLIEGETDETVEQWTGQVRAMKARRRKP